MNRDVWWIDLLENELPVELRQDVAKIFARSSQDMRSLTDLSRLREAIRQSDPAIALWDAERASALTEKINLGLDGHIKTKPARIRLAAPAREQDDQLKSGST